MSDTQATMTYPTEEQHGRWKEEANDRDMSLSNFIQAMVEAGTKKVEAVEVEPDETRQELRDDRNRLKEEVEQLREQVEYLEEQSHTTERQQVIEAIEKNPGAEFDEIVNYVIQKTGGRVSDHLNTLGDEIEERDGRYYPTDD